MRPIGISVLILILYSITACSSEQVDFNTDIKPLLNKRCISCHGGVKRNGDFSLLFRKEALDTTASGVYAIIPGDPHGSEMIRRITSNDPEVRMPFKEDPLPKEEIDLLTKWIEQGAKWGDHWAYISPKPVEVPDLEENEEWANNEIDAFVFKQMQSHSLSPSEKADKITLIRRVYLDLIGIPPTPEQAETFLQNDDPNAYLNVVDELLASPKFGEKWASWWLDLARYSDTKGYERDAGRTIWRYRDWVIKAFNEDLGLDQFTIDQLAGDLMPSLKDDQLIATAFHRNTMSNDEGGTEDEEFRVAAIIDRVNTTMETWQSTTFGCVQCHSHPYDPFRHEEYYQMLAFFNNTRDEDLTGEYPNLRIYQEKEEKELVEIQEWINENVSVEKGKEINKFLKTGEPKYNPHDFDQFVNSELVDTKWLGIRSGGHARLANINLKNKSRILVGFWNRNNSGSMEIRKGSIDGDVVAHWKIPNTNGKRKVVQIPLIPSENNQDLYFKMINTTIPVTRPVATIEWLAFLEDLPEISAGENEKVQAKIVKLMNAEVENVPILIENTSPQIRKTFVFERGNWLVHGEEVTPKIPEYLNDTMAGQFKNRLDLAKWLVSDTNPLTARTFVNRIWEQIFGNGIVETLEDFGTQGVLPSHPELLDWLAIKLKGDYQWSMKKLIKLIVTSSTYQQDARTNPTLLAADPTNKWLARGPRVRLSAEQIRDQALAVSGLLSDKMYGPGVMPFQPEGVWQTVYNAAKWTTSENEDRYRRAVYTYMKRTSPYPSLMMFDGSSREVCLSRRIRTNTPLQALVTLNDPVYIEAAENLAFKMEAYSALTEDQIKYGYKRTCLKEISDSKLQILSGLYHEAFEDYRKSNDLMLESKAENPKVAALRVVAIALLNLDEFITKE